jgi:RNA polymerase sigma-70 factor (ECF subfamily)
MSGCDANVIGQAGRGDALAFERLVNSYQASLYNLCFRMLGEAGEAEDAAQETFLRVYLHWQCYDPRREFKTWLFAIATHFCIDRLRRRHLALQPWDAEHDYQGAVNTEIAPDPEQIILQTEGEHETQALLARLASKDRAVVVMHYWGDMSYAEMAAATGSTVGAMKSRMHRARAQLAGTVRHAARARQRCSVGN